MEITSQSVMSCDLSFSRIHSSLERQKLPNKIHTNFLMIGPLTVQALTCPRMRNARQIVG